MRFFCLALLAILFNWFALKTSAQEAPSCKKWRPQFNTPGAQLAVRELARDKAERVTVVSYIFSASGLPKDKIYRFSVWELGRDPQLGLDGTIDYDGTIMLMPRSEENTNPGPKADEQGRWSASVGSYVRGKKEGFT